MPQHSPIGPAGPLCVALAPYPGLRLANTGEGMDDKEFSTVGTVGTAFFALALGNRIVGIGWYVSDRTSDLQMFYSLLRYALCSNSDCPDHCKRSYP
jgi:hypothetical protein